jgi:integrase
MADVITDMFVRNLKSSEKEYTRREKGGFGIRVHPSGRKVFFFLYRVDGQRRFLNLGDYPGTSLKQAREDYEEAKAKVKALKAGRAEGVDPLEIRKTKQHEREERRKAPTIPDLVDEYIERHAKKFKRSWKDDERLLKKEIVSIWGNRKAEEIKKRDVILLLESIVDRGTPAMSNQVLKVCRKMFNFAVERDILQFTPFLGVKALAPNTSRERTLTEAEIKTLWNNLDYVPMSDEIRHALKLVLVTAQRPGEVTGMHTREIEGRWWTIPAERAKNGREHRVYLTDTALELVGDIEGKGFVFPCPHQMKEQSIDSHALPVAVRRNVACPLTDKKGKPLYDADGKPATENRLGVEKFTPHDLRRTAATFMAGMGFMDEIIDAVLNHVKQGVIRTYNRHKYDKEKQQALEAWERKLNSIIFDIDSKVIPLRRKTV